MQKQPQKPKRETLTKNQCRQFGRSFTASCTHMTVQMALLKYMAKGPELRIVTKLYIKEPCAKGSTKSNFNLYSAENSQSTIRSSLNLGGFRKYVKRMLSCPWCSNNHINWLDLYAIVYRHINKLHNRPRKSDPAEPQ